MGLLNFFSNSRAVRNAVQQQGYGSNGDSTLWINKQINPHELFFSGLNRNGKYDNFYGDSNRIVTGASDYPFYYVIDDEVQEPEPDTFAYYLKRPNDSFTGRKVREQVYTELITHGYSDLFLWRKDGKEETRIFEPGKKYDESLYRGFTLVSGYDSSKFTQKDRENIVRITLGASQQNVFMGYSPSQAAESWRKMQDEMGLHMTAFARNAGLPIGQWLITAESPTEYAKIKEKLEEKTAGAKNNGKVLYSYVPSEAKQAQIVWQQFTSQDVQDYTEQLEFAEKKITQDFGVPGTIKGTNDNENYATANVSKQGFVQWTLKPIVLTFKEQLEFHIDKRFNLTGEIAVDIEIPELADESLVKIQATEKEVALFDQKVAEGYTAESVVRAFNLPERFLLLDTVTDAERRANKAKKASKPRNKPEKRDEFARHYQNTLTERERQRLENGFEEIVREYALNILSNGVSDGARKDFEGKMTAHFGEEYVPIYEKTLNEVADALTDVLEVVDVSSLNLTDEELTAAVNEYNRRVKEFSESFTSIINDIEGETLEVRSRAAEPHVHLTAVTESEHSRIVSELKGWTKSQEEFPVRVYKSWKTLPGACPECQALQDVKIDVTALFIKNPSNEIYEVQAGGLHPQCRCYVRYEMEKE